MLFGLAAGFLVLGPCWKYEMGDHGRLRLRVDRPWVTASCWQSLWRQMEQDEDVAEVRLASAALSLVPKRLEPLSRSIELVVEEPLVLSGPLLLLFPELDALSLIRTRFAFDDNASPMDTVSSLILDAVNINDAGIALLPTVSTLSVTHTLHVPFATAFFPVCDTLTLSEVDTETALKAMSLCPGAVHLIILDSAIDWTSLPLMPDLVSLHVENSGPIHIGASLLFMTVSALSITDAHLHPLAAASVSILRSIRDISLNGALHPLVFEHDEYTTADAIPERTVRFTSMGVLSLDDGLAALLHDVFLLQLDRTELHPGQEHRSVIAHRIEMESSVDGSLQGERIHVFTHATEIVLCKMNHIVLNHIFEAVEHLVFRQVDNIDLNGGYNTLFPVLKEIELEEVGTVSTHHLPFPECLDRVQICLGSRSRHLGLNQISDLAPPFLGVLLLRDSNIDDASLQHNVFPAEIATVQLQHTRMSASAAAQLVSFVDYCFYVVVGGTAGKRMAYMHVGPLLALDTHNEGHWTIQHVQTVDLSGTAAAIETSHFTLRHIDGFSPTVPCFLDLVSQTRQLTLDHVEPSVLDTCSSATVIETLEVTRNDDAAFHMNRKMSLVFQHVVTLITSTLVVDQDAAPLHDLEELHVHRITLYQSLVYVVPALVQLVMQSTSFEHVFPITSQPFRYLKTLQLVSSDPIVFRPQHTAMLPRLFRLHLEQWPRWEGDAVMPNVVELHVSSGHAVDDPVPRFPHVVDLKVSDSGIRYDQRFHSPWPSVRSITILSETALCRISLLLPRFPALDSLVYTTKLSLILDNPFDATRFSVVPTTTPNSMRQAHRSFPPRSLDGAYHFPVTPH